VTGDFVAGQTATEQGMWCRVQGIRSRSLLAHPSPDTQHPVPDTLFCCSFTRSLYMSSPFR